MSLDVLVHWSPLLVVQHMIFRFPEVNLNLARGHSFSGFYIKTDSRVID
jgi:hypothetical protein